MAYPNPKEVEHYIENGTREISESVRTKSVVTPGCNSRAGMFTVPSQIRVVAEFPIQR